MKKVAPGLLVLGLLQMAGDLLDWPAVKGIGAATVASPAPKVFSTVRGFETYSTRFLVEWTEPDGLVRSTAITPEAYARLRGPYNRRNIYGAALAYGPVMPPELRDPVMRRALCGDRPLLRELGITVTPGAPVRIRFEPRPGADMGALPRIIGVDCEGR